MVTRLAWMAARLVSSNWCCQRGTTFKGEEFEGGKESGGVDC
jgi:hypothetical protein